MGGMGKQGVFWLYAPISGKRYEMRPKLLLTLTIRKLLMRFRLVPRSMTLDDLELL